MKQLERHPIPLDPQLLNRLRQLTNQVASLARDTDEWNRLQSVLPHSLPEHLDRLHQVSQSRFASLGERAAVAQIDDLHLKETALLGGLLLPGQPQAWDSLTNLPALTDTPLRPETPSDVEKAAYL